MKDTLSAKNMLSFFISIEEFKNVMRHSWTSNPKRQESTAEHSWMLAFMAIILFDYLSPEIDRLKVLKLVLLHDLAEVITTDIPVFEISQRQNNKHENEKKALDKLYKDLPENTKKELIGFWEEFEDKKTLEAKIAQALDKMEATIQHNIADFSTWDQNDFDVHAFYRNDYFDFDNFLRELRNEVEDMGIKKIVSSHNTHRINFKHQSAFKDRYAVLIASEKSKK